MESEEKPTPPSSPSPPFSSREGEKQPLSFEQPPSLPHPEARKFPPQRTLTPPPAVLSHWTKTCRRNKEADERSTEHCLYELEVPRRELEKEKRGDRSFAVRPRKRKGKVLKPGK